MLMGHLHPPQHAQKTKRSGTLTIEAIQTKRMPQKGKPKVSKDHVLSQWFVCTRPNSLYLFMMSICFLKLCAVDFLFSLSDTIWMIPMVPIMETQQVKKHACKSQCLQIDYWTCPKETGCTYAVPPRYVQVAKTVLGTASQTLN